MTVGYSMAELATSWNGAAWPSVAVNRGRRWRRGQASAGWRNSTLAAFTLALLAHALLLALWWHEAPLPGLRLLPREAVSVRLFETAPTPLPMPDPALAIPPAREPRTRPLPQRSQPQPLPQLAPAQVQPPQPAQVDPTDIDWPAAISEAARATTSTPQTRDPLAGAPLPALPGDSVGQWGAPPASPEQRLQRVGAALSSAPVTGGSLLNKLVAPSFFDHMLDSDLVDKQNECHPTADGWLRCPKKVRDGVPGAR